MVGICQTSNRKVEAAPPHGCRNTDQHQQTELCYDRDDGFSGVARLPSTLADVVPPLLFLPVFAHTNRYAGGIQLCGAHVQRCHI